jgi:hypothetical protein
VTTLATAALKWFLEPLGPGKYLKFVYEAESSHPQHISTVFPSENKFFPEEPVRSYLEFFLAR